MGTERRLRNEIATVIVLLAIFVTFLSGVNAIFVKYDGYSFPSIALRQQAVTIANNTGLCSGCGDGVSQYTISSPTKAGYAFTCNDTDNCRIYVGETGSGIKEGMIFEISNDGASNSIIVQETANVMEMNAATVTLGTNDSMLVKRNQANTTWRQLAAASNN